MSKIKITAHLTLELPMPASNIATRESATASECCHVSWSRYQQTPIITVTINESARMVAPIDTLKCNIAKLNEITLIKKKTANPAGQIRLAAVTGLDSP